MSDNDLGRNGAGQQNRLVLKLAVLTAIIGGVGTLVGTTTNTINTLREAVKMIWPRTNSDIQDEALLANGTTPPFYSCSTQVQCQSGFVCVDNGGDKAFFCKPICETDAACAKWPFPQLRCLVHLRVNGTTFPHRVCNDSSPSYLHP
jgi:hypothetical protein